MAHVGRGRLVEVESLDGALAVVTGEVLQAALGTRAASYNQPETMIRAANDPLALTITERLKVSTTAFTFKTHYQDTC